MKGGVYRMLTFDESFNLKLVFPKPKGGKGK